MLVIPARFILKSSVEQLDTGNAFIRNGLCPETKLVSAFLCMDSTIFLAWISLYKAKANLQSVAMK